MLHSLEELASLTTKHDVASREFVVISFANPLTFDKAAVRMHAQLEGPFRHVLLYGRHVDAKQRHASDVLGGHRTCMDTNRTATEMKLLTVLGL